MHKFSLLISLIAASSFAFVPDSRAGGAVEAAEAGVETQEHHEYHDNIVELFLGYAQSRGGHKKEGYSVGLGYERRLNQILGIGVFTEYAAGDLKEWIVAAPLVLHPYKGLRLMAAPGIDLGREHRSKQFLLRFGVAYEFEVAEKWVITPAVNVDLVNDEQVFVYGLGFSFAF